MPIPTKPKLVASRTSLEKVDDALESKPPSYSMMVVVACSPPVCFVQGQEKDILAVGQADLQSWEIQSVVKSPLVANKVVEVALVEVELDAVKFWRVDDPATNKLELMVEEALEKKPLSNARVVEVAFSPDARVVKGKDPAPPAGQADLQSPLIQSIVVEAIWDEKRVEEALVNVWSAVQALALVRLRPILLAVEPL